jgi:hypothetical protein
MSRRRPTPSVRKRGISGAGKLYEALQRLLPCCLWVLNAEIALVLHELRSVSHTNKKLSVLTLEAAKNIKFYMPVRLKKMRARTNSPNHDPWQFLRIASHGAAYA